MMVCSVENEILKFFGSFKLRNIFLKLLYYLQCSLSWSDGTTLIFTAERLSLSGILFLNRHVTKLLPADVNNCEMFIQLFSFSFS